MNVAERFRQIDDMFQQALDRDPALRLQFVTDACGADRELYDEVTSLLEAAHSDFPTFSRAIGDAARTVGELDQPQPGDVVGAYRLIRKIAEGGMGAVYEAERADGLFEGGAAIKFVRANRVSRDQLADRLRAEQRIMAGLAHPNIGRLLDAGVTVDGAPYLVMEFVDGLPLDSYCRERKPDLHARLSLFEGICSAVAYAHRNLVVHRDIKPNNILVTAEGTPKLLDFGIAKLLDIDPGVEKPGLTQVGERVMTPEYASPELIRGEPVTTTVDIFALGVVFYELLAGRHPFRRDGQQRWELERAVCEEDPPRPAASDLGDIALKALAKDPRSRYATAEQLIEDLRRYFAGEPVSAARPDVIYRLRKFVRRNRGFVFAAIGALVILLAGLYSTIREQRRTKQRFDEVRDLATVFLFDFDESIRSLPGATTARHGLVTRALSSLEALSRDSGRDESLQLDLARAYHKVAAIQWITSRPSLGDRKGSAESTGKEISIREAIIARSPSNIVNSTELAAAYGYLAAIQDQGNPDLARTYVDKEGALLTSLLERFPDDAGVQDSASAYHSQVGLKLHQASKLPESLAEQRYAIALSERAARGKPNDMETLRFQAWYHIYAGDVLGGGGAELHLGDRGGALVETEKGLEILQQIGRRNPNNALADRDVQAAKMRVAGILQATGKYDEAIQIRKEVDARFDALWEADPKNGEAARDAAVGHSSLGYLLNDRSRLDESGAELARAEAINNERIQRFPQDLRAPIDLANLQHGIGELFQKEGRPAAAIDAWRKAIVLRESGIKANPEDGRLLWRQTSTYYELAIALEQTKDWPGARVAFTAALQGYGTLKARGLINPRDKDKPEEIAKRLEALQSQ